MKVTHQDLSVTIPVQDDDPYVRKTAAVCVAKLHDINAELVEDRGFLDTLKVKLATSCAYMWLFSHALMPQLTHL